MPRTAALAVAASRGFGEFTSSLTLTTVTFTSSTTWVAPAYLTNIVTLTGQGANATSDDYSGDTSGVNLYRCLRESSSGGLVATYDWSFIYNGLQDWITFVNTGTPGTRSAGPVDTFYNRSYRINPDNTYQGGGPGAFPAPGYGGDRYFQIGTGYNGSNFSVPSSGTITYANTPSGTLNVNVGVGFNPVYLGSNGAAATGVGKTFPGGTYDFPTGIGGPAPTTTFTNVAVTPSTSYSIVVPGGGQVSISYYAVA
jgi:hypothetical protein